MTERLPHQQRVIDEATELSERLDKLLTFMCSAKFNDVTSVEQTLLSAQALYMRAYLNTLHARIEQWNKA